MNIDFNKLQNQLVGLLPELIANSSLVLEYGDAAKPCGIMSFIRIRYLATHGGMQFCVKQLSIGVEGSGLYSPDVLVTSSAAMNLVIHYHRPIRADLRPKDTSLALSWYVLTPEQLDASDKRATAIIEYRNASHRALGQFTQ